MTTKTNLFNTMFRATTSQLWNTARGAAHGALGFAGSQDMRDGILAAIAAGAITTVAAAGADMARNFCLGQGYTAAQMGTETITGIEERFARVLPRPRSLKATIGTRFASLVCLALARRAYQSQTGGVMAKGISLTIFAAARTLSALEIAHGILKDARIANALHDVEGPRSIAQAVGKALIRGGMEAIKSRVLLGGCLGALVAASTFRINRNV